MLDFREEIAKYKPVLGLEDVEESIQSDEIKDVMDLLQHITKQITRQITKQIDSLEKE